LYYGKKFEQQMEIFKVCGFREGETDGRLNISGIQLGGREYFREE
jgi:hypothetical protein